MTLREKFKPKISINTDGEAGRYAKECEQIADDYAIEFLNWYISKSSILDKKYIGKTSKELLEIYKKEL
jgi:hypothetical protein